MLVFQESELVQDPTEFSVFWRKCRFFIMTLGKYGRDFLTYFVEKNETSSKKLIFTEQSGVSSTRRWLPNSGMAATYIHPVRYSISLLKKPKIHKELQAPPIQKFCSIVCIFIKLPYREPPPGTGSPLSAKHLILQPQNKNTVYLFNGVSSTLQVAVSTAAELLCHPCTMQ